MVEKKQIRCSEISPMHVYHCIYNIYTCVCVCAGYMRLDAPIFQVDGKNGINSGNATRISTTLNLTYHKLDLFSCELRIHGGSDVHASTASSREGRVARRYRDTSADGGHFYKQKNKTCWLLK